QSRRSVLFRRIALHDQRLPAHQARRSAGKARRRAAYLPKRSRSAVGFPQFESVVLRYSLSEDLPSRMARCAIYGVVRLFEGINDERSPQARASRMIVRNRAAPSVALITARINPEPRLMPSRGKSQLAMNAPTMPMAISPIRPVLAPRTILPASQPAMRPTSRMMRMPSFERYTVPFSSFGTEGDC